MGGLRTPTRSRRNLLGRARRGGRSPAEFYLEAQDTEQRTQLPLPDNMVAPAEAADPSSVVPSLAERAKNYLGQLRPYSYSDLVLLLLAAGATTGSLIRCTLLWFGFLIHLEWKHKDRGRAPWPAWAWKTLWGVAAILAAATGWREALGAASFIVLARLYTLKKRVPALGAVSPLLNGGLKAALLLLVPPATVAMGMTVWATTAARNLLGDFRDVEKDRGESVRTIPVRLGFERDIKWLYPAGLAATTVVWAAMLSWWWAVPIAWAVQWTTYHLTPR